MPAARPLCFAIALAMSIAVTGGLASAQTSPDWPFGGTSATPSRDSDRPVAVIAPPAVDVARLLDNFRVRLAASWVIRAQRPVGTKSSAIVVQRRVVK